MIINWDILQVGPTVATVAIYIATWFTFCRAAWYGVKLASLQYTPHINPVHFSMYILQL